MLISYNRYKGMVTKIRVIKSGGVMMAATSMMIRKECLRYFERMSEEMNPSFANAKAMTGSWKTTPIKSVRVVKVEM